MAPVGEVDSKGHLVLEEDPEVWIKNNPASRLALVTSLKLKLASLSLSYLSLLEIPYHLHDLKKNLTSLDLTSLYNLTSLYLFHCDCLVELPANIGQLVSLTQLKLEFCDYLKSLPMSIANLCKLTSLTLNNCNSLIELPSNLGQMKSLSHLQLYNCNKIESLPDSITNLRNLETLDIEDCENLTQLPVHLKASHLKLRRCCNLNLPTGLRNLKYLGVSACNCSHQSFENLKDADSLQHLCIRACIGGCRTHQNNIIKLPASFNQLVNLQVLSIHTGSLVELPANLNGLAKLCVIDVQDFEIKCLPWSITALGSLRLLMLPFGFRLHTLPSDLNDQITISVDRRHVRKTWKELKEDISFSQLKMATGAPQHSSIISPSGYLRLEGEGSLGPWIQSNYDSLMSVQILELEDLYKISDYSIRNMTQLNQLTHLYISGYECLPDSYFATNTRLRHLSFENGDKIISNDSLSKLSNLESLHIDLNGPKLPANINFPASIKCLSLRGGNMKTLHDSLAKLPNLKTIDLYEFRNLNLFPTNLYLAKVRLIDCSIASLPTCLLHLEILCNNPFTCEVGQPECINKLVNLKTLSISCHEMEFVPSMETLYNLETLQFKDCFSLKELPSYLGELVSLRNLDISGTRIKSLPGSIMKLCNLQHLILPGCFSLETLPRNLTQVFTIDNTLETYYKGMGYFFSGFQTSTEISDSIVTARGCTQTQGRESCNKIVPVAGVDETVSSEQGSRTPSLFSHYFNIKKYESATSSELRDSISQVHKDSQFSATKDLIDENSQYAACSSRNQFSSSRNDDLATFFKQTLAPISENDLTTVFKQPLATMTSENDLVTFFKQPLATMTSENERLPTKVNADKLLEDSQFNGKDLINEKSQYVTCSSQNQFSTSGNGDFVTIFDDDLNTELRLTTVTSENEQLPKKANADKILDDLCYNKGETSNPSGESSHAMQNTFTQEIKQGIAPTCDTKEIDCGEINHCALESEQNYIPQSNNVRVKIKRKDITLEMLQPFWSNHTTLVDAAEELGVKRSTLKRRIKELNVIWPRKGKKQQLDAN